MTTGMYEPGPIRPVCKAGEQILTIDRAKYRLYRVASVEPFGVSHPLVVNLGAIAAGVAMAPFNTQTQLDNNDGELSIFRCRVLDDFWFAIYQPAGKARFLNLNQTITINAFSHMTDPCGHLTEFSIFEDDRPNIAATNPTGYNLVQARVAFWGIKYVLEGKDGSLGGSISPIAIFNSISDAVSSGQKFTAVPVGGWGR